MLAFGRFCGILLAVETVTKLTNELVASYARVGGINHLDGKNLPSKRAITGHHAGFAAAAVPRIF